MLSNSFVLQAKYRYQCDRCDFSFKCSSHRAKHIRFSHDASGDGDAFCPYCYRADFNTFTSYQAHYVKCQRQMRVWIWRRIRNRGMRCRSTHEQALMKAALKIPYSLDTVQRCGQGVSVAVMYMYHYMYI